MFVSKLLNHMDSNRYAICCPHANDTDMAEKEELLPLSSGYIQRAAKRIPKQGSRAPWRLDNNYFYDFANLSFGGYDDGAMEFTTAAAPAAGGARSRL